MSEVPPLVSFVVPCYNLGHLLSECVTSILAQDYANFEVFIMDNCSPDCTPEVAQSFQDPRVRHVRNESNLGHIRNYNKGISLARGKYFWLLSADDMLRSPQVLGRFVRTLERNPNTGYVFCRAVELHDGRETGLATWADHGDEDRFWNGIEFLTELIRVNTIVAPTVMMRRECLDRVGPFQVDLPFASDWYMWSILALHYDVAYMAEPMVRYRIHEKSLTTQYAGDYGRKCGGDELSVLWRIGAEAERADQLSLRDACRASFVHWAYHLLVAPLLAQTPSMSVTEFEEILRDRIKDPEVMKTRASVYAELTKAIMDLRGRDVPPIPRPDELGLLWDMGRQAKEWNVPEVSSACETVFLDRALHYLTPLRGTSGMSVEEFEQILKSRVSEPGHLKSLRTRVYNTAGDRQFSSGERLQARNSYRLALSADPWQGRTLAKYLLLHTGSVGMRLRHLAN